jgi:hypothetical protein
MVDPVERRSDLRPQKLAGDLAYGAVKLLKWPVDRKITPHVPVWDKSARADVAFSRADFAFDQKRHVFAAPKMPSQTNGISVREAPQPSFATPSEG